MKKILLSIFLAVSMLLTNICVMAEENAGTEYNKAVEFLSALNVISVDEDNKDFSAQSYVTREEFCVYISRAFKIEPDIEARQIFSDVPADSELAHYISTLYDRGVVSGYGGEFRPRDIITFNEAVKMLVSIMNYDYSGETGGYPSGYLRIASSIGITEDVYVVDRLTKAVAAQLIYNGMTVPIMEIIGVKDGNIIFKTNSDKSILTELYSVYEGEGIVMASEKAAFTSGSDSLETDEVLLDDVVYKVGKTNVANLLGHYIEFLYSEVDDNEFEIIMVLEDDGEEFIINSNQIIDFEDNAYKYEDENGKTKKVRLNSDFLVMYNFDYPISGFHADMMKPDMGRVKLIKSGKGSGYTAVIIEDYVNHIVSSVDKDNEVIYTKDRRNVKLRNKEYTIFNAEGKVTDLSSIKEWTVVSVLTSADGGKTTIYVSEGELSGKISRMATVAVPKVVIDSVEYYIDTKVIPDIGVNKEYTFYLDYCGNIAGVNEAYLEGLRYAYLISAKMDYEYDPNGYERVVVKLFDEDNPQAIINSGLSLSVNILKYQLNSNGEINTLYVYDGSSNKYIRELFNGTTYWTVKQRSFGPTVTMESDVPVFVIPEGSGVEDYQVTGLSSFENDRSASVKIYTMGDNVYGEVILRDAQDTSYTKPIAIVKKVEYTLDKYGDECINLQLLYDGGDYQFTLTDEEVLGTVDEGDIIKISLNHLNEIQGILHVYDASENEFLLSTNPYEPQGSAGFRSANRIFSGYAYEVKDGLMKYCKTLPSGNTIPETENALLSAFRFYVVDGPEVRIGSENDIKPFKEADSNCSKVIVHTMWWDPVDIVIIK